MKAAKIIVESGIKPKVDFDSEILRKAADIADLISNKLATFLLDLSQLQHDALDRLEEWTPTERLLTLKEAAAYLKFKPRTLNSWCSGKKPRVQFCKIGGELRFKKVWLDAAVENGSVRPPVVKL